MTQLKVYFKLKSILSDVPRKLSEKRQQITVIWQSLSILSKVLMLIPSTIMISFLFALTFPILLTLVFVIPGFFMAFRWASIVSVDDFNTGDMKVPTFYSTREDGRTDAFIIFMSIVGVVFGGIHCAGWFFNFPSSDEAMLWRVCSVVLTGIAFLLSLLIYLTDFLQENFDLYDNLWNYFFLAFFTIILLAYVASRLLLLVEAFISLRHLTLGMLALVKWTSFIPHI